LTPIARPYALRADGADLELVEVEIVDAAGRRCPTALNTVEFELTGPAEWRGGLAQGSDNFILARTLPVEGGVNRVLIRTRREAGRITLSARSGSLRPASVAFTSRPVAVVGGLSTSQPADGLPLYLDRGPTPAGASFVTSRIAVPVASATASNGGDPALAIDDNEATSWSGRGPVTFNLARAARLNEITAKFSGFRARSYPIRITIDGKEVFRGVTPRSLGYVTLPLKPVTGQSVKIEVMGAAEAREAFGDIRELQDQGRAMTGEENVAPGELGIIEIEFNEPP
jgi:beta-galactosidase